MAVEASLLNGEANKEEVTEELDFAFGKCPFTFTDMPFNPFANDSVALLDPLEIVKIILVLPIFLLRVILLLLMFPLGYVLTAIAMIGAKNALTKPFPPWRRTLLWPVRLCARGVLLACGFNWIKVKGKAAPRDIAPILVSNHCTFVDPVFYFFAHLPMFVIAKENFDIPLAGKIMRANQAIPVDRSSPTSRRDAAGNIRRRSVCNDWNRLALFPEATTTNGKALVSFKTGAFAPGLPIQPCIVRYPHVRCDPSWVVEGPEVHVLLFRLMTQFHNHMEVEYLDVLEPNKKELKDPRLFAERCRIEMARALNVTVTEHAFGDVALAMEGAKIKAPKGFANVEFGRFERLFKLDLREGKKFLHKFNKMDRNSSEFVTIEGFLATLHLPETPVTRKLFSLFDTSDRGHLNFREYVAGTAFIGKHRQFKEAVESIFSEADEDKDGALKQDEAVKSLTSLLPSISEDQVSQIFEGMDLDKDGAISRTEFDEFMQKNPEYVAAILIAKPKILSTT